MAALRPLILIKVNDGVYRVQGGQNEHVGNLKLIGGQWKFKAVGCDERGRVIPGGGPLTHMHNTTFAVPDESLINATLLKP
ncbi:hypothetical protein [Polaromonas sp.]|uniref:hypothetical protein n=1 Tax=Polaromonas sp. TaxID=1869339 RepID=UPI003264E179